MRHLLSGIVTLSLLTTAGCANLGTPVGAGIQGGLFNWATYGTSGPKPGGSLVGKACARSFLSIFSGGDASVEKAASNAGINIINSVDREVFSIYVIYGHVCVIVHGEKGSVPQGGVTGFTDTVIFKNGRKLTGVKATITQSGEIVITKPDGTTETVRKNQVSRIQK